MKKIALLSALFVLLSIEMTAQERWAVELRPQVNFPIQKPDVMDLNTGYGFEAMLSYKFMPQLGAYAGWGWNKFGVDGEAEFSGFDIDETGYSLGLRFIHPITDSMSYLVGLGGIFKHFEAEDSSGDITGDSDHELGFEVMGGVVFELRYNLELRPQLMYRSISAETHLGSVDADLDLQYISLGLGVAKKF